jgi:putative aldouronate transport system permease protein
MVKGGIGHIGVKPNRIRLSRVDQIFTILNYALLILLLASVVYPLYFVLIASVSSPGAIYNGKVWLYPVMPTLDGYHRIWQSSDIWIGYWNSLRYTLVGTVINLFLTLPAAYALANPKFRVRHIFIKIITFTMFFSAGLIPTYILVSNLGLRDRIWAMVLPEAVIVWYLIIARTFFQTTIPADLRDAAEIDGATDFVFFTRVVLQISPALISVLTLYYMVFHWNTYFSALIYLKSMSMYPLQLVLRNILIQNSVSPEMVSDLTSVAEQQRIAEQIKYGAIVVASVPLLIIYPFLQKYFIKGIMIGAIKG